MLQCSSGITYSACPAVSLRWWPIEAALSPENTPMASSLFCLEVYVHKVEKLAKRLRSSPPALAVRFLDYAPVIVEPGSEGVGASRDGSAWYGSGKRCVFECEEVALGKKLKARSESALLVHAIEAGIDKKRRKQFGSATVALAGFADGACGNEPLGAVRTWGRVECRVLVADAYGRTVLVATASVALASLDASLKVALGGPRGTVTDGPAAARLSVDVPVGRRSLEVRRSKSPPPRPDGWPRSTRHSGALAALDAALASPSTASSRGAKSTSPVSPPSPLRRSAFGFVDVPSPAADAEGSCACCDVTLKMPESSVGAFDAARRAALAAAVARAARVGDGQVELLSWRSGSLVVDARCRFGGDDAAAAALARRLRDDPPCDLVPRALFGPFEVKDAAAKRCAVPRAVAEPPPAAALPSPLLSPPRRAHAPEPAAAAAPQPQKQPTFRTFDVFRGDATFADDDDFALGDCPPLVFHESAPRVEATLAAPRAAPEPAAPPSKSPPRPSRSPPPPRDARKLPRDHGRAAANLRGDGRPAKVRPPLHAPRHKPPKPPAPKPKPKAPKPRPAALAVVHEHDVEGPGPPPPPPPPLSPRAEESLAAGFERVRGDDGRAALADLAASTGLRHGGDDAARVTFGEYLAFVADGDAIAPLPPPPGVPRG